MARYSVHSMLVSLNISDTPLRYLPPYGPAMDFTVTYNERETQQPATFAFSNLGPKWTFEWLSYVSDDPNIQLPLTNLYRSGGGAEIFAFDSGSAAFRPDPQTHAILVKTAAGYERRMPDGSKQVFTLSDGAMSYPRRIFMTQIVDAAGIAINIDYDASFRVSCVRNPLIPGQVTTISYESSDPWKITKVTDPGGRSARFDYTGGQLTKITDEIGIQSQFHYVPGTDTIDTLTTPYGPTLFARGGSGANRWIEATDPLGQKERVEYRDNAAGIGASDPVPNIAGITNADLHLRNTFYWDKKAMEEAPGVLTQAQITHWLLNADGSVSGIPSSKKQPLENRVWYTYDNQPDYQHVGPSANPTQIARFLADGSTQHFRYEYDNAVGKMTKSTDPLERVTKYVYEPTNQIDLIEVWQTAGTNDELLRKLTYLNHQVKTDKDAGGQMTVYGYNANMQITSRENARHEITTFAYGDGTNMDVPRDYLQSITSPLFNTHSATTTLGYDIKNRVKTVTNSDDYKITIDRDDLDREINVTYPDTTFEEFNYIDENRGMTLDLTASRDRRGLWTYRHYDANQHMDTITDPENRTTHYGWCGCGSLTSIADPNANVTTFHRDIQGRVYEKIFQDNTKITYLYEGQTATKAAGATSRLQSSTDAKNQQTNYFYDRDDNLHQVSYSNTLLPTPTVTYAYDLNYNRIKSMITNGIGETDYEYYSVADGILGAGKLHTTSGPLPSSTITLGYDELGRVISQDINGTPASFTYDSLGRAGASSNALGSFGRTYDGVTPRLLTLSYPHGQTANYSYFDNLNDRRLQTIENLTGAAATLSRHEYSYDATGQIQTWNKTLGATETGLSFEYDNADQLTSVIQPGVGFGYGYDLAGNRLSNIFTGAHNRQRSDIYTANNLNQLDTVTRSNGFGSERIESSFTYDANGNMTDDGGNRTFEWDAANRLVAINYKDAGSRTEFVYDGLSRRVKILEYDGSSASTIEPGSDRYETFTVGPFVGPVGNYTLLLQGLNSNGGHNAMLLDDVTLDGASVTNGSFETPTVADYQYRPADAAWIYGDSAGIAATPGTFTGGFDAPDGVQSAFIEGNGALRRTFTLSSGPHSFSFQAVQAVSVNENSQQVRVTFLGLATSTKTFVWSGNTIAEERDASGMNVTKRFFAEGEQRVGEGHVMNYYYSRDHLGSVREVTNASGVVKARYDYDAWGNQTVVSGNMSFDFGYTGHYRHAASNLYLAAYRAYDPTMARWISRDPIGEMGGINLYGYVRNNALNLVDPLGEDATLVFDRAAGTLTAIDNQTGATATATNVFSGNVFANDPAHEADPFEGPVPAGIYLLGEAYEHGPGPGDQTWYHLYGPDGQGGYRDKFPVRDPQGNIVYRDSINLHTGRASDGCVTVTSDVPHGPDYPRSAQYNAIKALLNSTAPYPYKGSNYSGWLIVR